MALQAIRMHLDSAWLSASEARRSLRTLVNEDNVYGFSTAIATADVGRVMLEIEKARVELERLLPPPATLPIMPATASIEEHRKLSQEVQRTIKAQQEGGLPRPITPADAACAEAAAGWLSDPEVPA